MKRYAMMLAALLLFAVPMKAERVTPETARKVATTFLHNNGAKANQLTDLSKAAGFPNLYIFTAEEGFVVMAADDCVKPILGYSLTNTFVTEGMPENVRGWLQGYNDEIQLAIENGVKSTINVEEVWHDLANGKTGASQAFPIVDALVQTQWNQGYPYNNQCPMIGGIRTVTGCVATAMAQVMKYWEHPSTGTDTHSYTWNDQTLGVDFGATPYDWDNMTNTYGSSSNSTQQNAVATLMYHCGVSVEMDYNTSGNGGSSASTYNVMSALQAYFSYAPCMQYKSKDDYGDEVWIIMLKRELNDGRPLQYRGGDAGGNGGHSFVCDGYDSDDNFHFNWGWGGYCDGFYSINDMEPGTGGIGAGNGVYTVGESAIFGIEPISSLAAPTLSASTAEGIATLTWTAVDGAVSYIVYKDGEKIVEGLTSTIYSDNNISFGVDYTYYVRAVDAETRSNPSNSVTIHSDYRNIAPKNLTATYHDGNAILEWIGYEGGLSTDLHYGTGSTFYIKCEGPVYWGQKYPSSKLTCYAGMCIDGLSINMRDVGDYSVYLYNGNTSISSNLLFQQDFTVTQSGLNTIEIANPIRLAVVSDLWVVFYSNNTNTEILIDTYTDGEAQNASYINDALELVGEDCYMDYSWPIKVHISDGEFAYSLFDDGIAVATNISNDSYSISNPANNTIHHYTVKTVYNGGESSASNMASLAVGTTSLPSLELGINDRITIAEGGNLTVSGTLTNTAPANLILESGAQLIHNTEGVQATVKRNIAPYTSNDNGWNFIASPVEENITPSESNGLLNGTVGHGNNTYDLYYYDEPTNLWKNYEATSFDLVHEKGYLYANGETDGTTLQFAGTITPSDESVTINGLSHSSEIFTGFNLVGNPFVCNATVDKDYYVVSGRTVTVPEVGHVIAPFEGVLVQVSENDNSVTFTKAASAKSTESKDCFDIVAMQDKVAIDRARLRFGEGEGLEKFSLDDKCPQISLQQNGHAFAVVYANGANELPLNFKAEKEGTYTLNIEAEHLDLDYLHLIDNLTGNDIDLLAEPSYSFDSHSTDYASRFRLVFSICGDAVGDEETFAYYANGEIRLLETCQGASLQIVDMTGRVIVCRDGVHTVSTMEMTTGVYVLRLVTSDGVKTQKMVIE